MDIFNDFDCILRCSKCDPSEWVNLPAEEVDIVINLKTDAVEFYATCPICGGAIDNARFLFGR